MTARRVPWAAVVALLATAVAWGSTFVVTKGAFENMSPLGVVTARLILSGATLAAVFAWRMRITRSDALWGVALGLVFMGGLVTQTLGLRLIAPSMSGFLTATYVIFTALIVAVFLRQRQQWQTWLAVGVMVLGISVLAWKQDGDAANLGIGAALTLLSALLFAVHIVTLGRRVTRANVGQLTLMQAVGGAVASLLVWPFLGEPVPTEPTALAQLLYLGVVCGAITLLLQSWAQSQLAATPAAVIMCSEPVWAAVFAVAFGFERLTLVLVVGGCLVVGGLLLAVVSGRSGRTADDVAREIVETA